MSDWRDVLSSPVHLAVRFVTSLPPGPPDVRDEIWRRMSNQDRRHSVQVAKRFVRRRGGATRSEVAGALLHDVGKVQCGLGTFGRVAATLLGRRTWRFSAYHDHEEIGADLAVLAGSDPVTAELIAGRGPAYPDLRHSDH
jgi:hypothetical protein